MFAVISDIHSNLEALTTVLGDIEKRGIKKIYCLGDVVGYGANPNECLDLIMKKTEFGVMGNHDFAVLYEPTNFNAGAESASYWTRASIEQGDKKQAAVRWDYLGSLTMRKTFEAKLGNVNAYVSLVHASPRKPINEYVFPDDVYTMPTKMTGIFEHMKHICFIGHTHLPGVFLEDPDFYTPEELGEYYPIVSNEKAIINVGSVGQPRDRDNRASYAYVDGNKVYFVRLDYDYETAANKIFEINDLEDFEGIRLAEGK